MFLHSEFIADQCLLPSLEKQSKRRQERQYWSESFAGNAFTLTVPEGVAEVTVTGGGAPIEGIPVYAFRDNGAYLNLTDTTDASGITSFRLPEQSYKFRADRMGSQYWSDVLALSPGITNPVSIDVGSGG